MISRNSQNSGFTLLEILVTLAVMSIVLLLIAGFLAPRGQGLAARQAAQRVAEAMRQDRGQAIASGQPVEFRLPALPAFLTVSAVMPPQGLVFEPDGSASGGAVLLTGGGQRLLISADWLTGRVQVTAP
jgi:general secretion pathway protein H